MTEYEREEWAGKFAEQLSEGLESVDLKREDLGWWNLSVRAFNIVCANNLSILAIHKLGEKGLLASFRHCGKKTAKELTLWVGKFMGEQEQGRAAFEELRFSDEEIDLFKSSHELSTMSLKVWQDAEKKGMRDFTSTLYEVAKRDHHISPDAVLAIAADEGLWEKLKENLSEMALAAIICYQQRALRKEVNMRVSGGRIIVMPGAK